MVETLMRSASDPGRVRGTCVAAPAQVEGGIARLGLLLNWRDVPIGDLVSERLRTPLPVLIENDAKASAIAAARAMSDRVLLSSSKSTSAPSFPKGGTRGLIRMTSV